MAGGFSLLASGLTGIQPGYNQEYDQSLQQMSDIAVGRTLQALSQNPGNVGMGQPPGAPPMGGMPPQMPPQSIGGGGQNTIGSPPMGVPAPQGGPAGMPPNAMGGPPMAPQPQMPPPGATPRGVGMSPAPGPPPQMPQQQQMPPQPPQPVEYGQQQQPSPQLDWRQIIQKVQQANPGAPPQVIAGAVNKFVPLMNAASAQEWRMVSEQLRFQQQQNQLDIAGLRAGVTERGQDIRADTVQQQIVSRETIAKMTVDERREAYQAGIISKQQMDDANREERGREADQRAQVQERGQDVTKRGQDIRADTAQQAETGRQQRFETNLAEREKAAAAKEQEAKARQDLSVKMKLAQINEKRRAAGLSDLNEEDFKKGNIPADFVANRPPQNPDEKNADDIAAFKRPPILSGWGGMGLPREQQAGTQNALQIRHPEFDQSQAVLDWQAEYRLAGNMNSTQQVRFRALQKSIDPLLDRIGELSKQMDLYGIPELNEVEMAKLRRQGNTPKGQLLARYETAFAAARGEIANFENGGYAPTDASWKTAYEQLDSARGIRAQQAALNEIRKITSYRIQGMDAVGGGLQPGGPNPYSPGGSNQPQQQPGIQFHYDENGNLIGGPRSELGGQRFAGGVGSGKNAGDAINRYESIYDKPKPPKPLQAVPKGFKLDEQGNYAREVGQG